MDSHSDIIRLQRNQGGGYMNDEEKKDLKNLCILFPKLDTENQKYILGIAEGMAMLRDDMNKKQLYEALN